MEWIGNTCEVSDKPPIVVGKAQKLVGLTFRSGYRPVGNFLGLGWTSGYALAGNDVTKVLNLLLKKEALGGFQT